MDEHAEGTAATNERETLEEACYQGVTSNGYDARRGADAVLTAGFRLAAATQRPDDREATLRAAVEAGGLVTSCREWPTHGERCDRPAEFVLWGKLFDAEALGPRCYNHAVKHAGNRMPSRADQWAVLDLRPLRAALAAADGTATTHGC